MQNLSPHPFLTYSNTVVFMPKALNIIIILLMILLCCPVNGLSAPIQDTPKTISTKDQYKEAKETLLRLQSDKNFGNSRENWMEGVRNFRRIYLVAPQTEYAPACLYTLGRMYQEIHHRFGLEKDLATARSYHKDNIAFYKDHRLADDSAYAIAWSYITVEKNEMHAIELLKDLIANYPDSNMAPKAKKTLKNLQDRDFARQQQKKPKKQLIQNTKTRQILPIKYWSSQNYSRVVVMTSGPVNYKETLLAATKNQPRRLYIDFSKALIAKEHQKTIPVDDGLLSKVRSAQFDASTVRVVLDLASISDFKIFSLPDPFRVIIDVHGEKPVAKLKPKGISNSQILVLQENNKRKISSGVMRIRPVEHKRILQDSKGSILTQREPPQNQTFTLAQQLGLGVRSIILDPGHGGKDPGAMAGGLKEKDLVLAIAKRLKPQLERELGCQVFLTRDDDTFISLEERTAIANSKGADLFISLHVNAHSQSKVKGLETYYLNFSTNDEAMRVAARENATSTYKMSDLQGILSEIMNNSKINESARLAQVVHDSIMRGAEDDHFKKTRDLGVKQAPFYVLIGAEMPAILIEMGFITNDGDRSNLTRTEFQNTMVDQITRAVQSYINNTTAANI